MLEITAKNNSKIKELKALISSNRERKEKNLFVLEGVRLCYDGVRSGAFIKDVFCTNECMDKFPNQIDAIKSNAENFYIVTKDIIKSVSDTVNPQGVICTLKKENHTFTYEKGKKYIALDTVQNPDNLGATARTAEALGIDGIIICGGCDIYNPKAQRAAMGSLLRMKIKITDSLEDEIAELEKIGIKSYATVPDSSAKSITDVDFSQGAMCIIGNEGNGIRPEILSLCDKITIKMQGRAESFNASVAASIVMWELMK